MKKVLSLSLITCLLASSFSLYAQDYKTAVGVRLSSSQPLVNNAISVKYFMSPGKAIEGLISFGDPLSIGGLYELHNPMGQQGISWYYGGGGYVGFVKAYNPTKLVTETNVSLGAMGVMGLDYKFATVPLNLSLDWKPELNIVSDINFEPSAIGFTARFTFNSKRVK